MSMKTRSGRTLTPIPSGASTPLRRGRSPQRQTRGRGDDSLSEIVRRKVPGSEADRAPVGGDRVSDSQESGLSTSSVGGTPDTVTRIVRRTVAGRGGEETVVEEESQGESDVARRIRDSARGLFSAAAKLAGSRGGSDSDMSESDTVLFSLTQSKTSDTHNQYIDFSDREDVPSGRKPKSTVKKRRTVTTRRAGDQYNYNATPRSKLPGVTAPGVQTEMTMHQQTTIRLLNGGGRETPEPLYGLDNEDGSQEIDNTTLVSVSQRPENTHPNPTTPELTEDVLDLGSEHNNGFLEAISAWFVSVTQFVGRFFTGETPVISHVGSFFSQVWSRRVSSGRSVTTYQEPYLYVWLLLLLSLVMLLVLFLWPIPHVKPTRPPVLPSEVPSTETGVPSLPESPLLGTNVSEQSPEKEPPTEPSTPALPPPQQIDVEELKQEIMNNVRGFVSESTNELRDDITKAVNSTVRNDLEQWLTGSRTSEKQGDQGLDEKQIVALILSELERRNLIWPNGTKVIESQVDTRGVEQPDMSKIRDSISQSVADELRESITKSVIDHISKELEKGLTESLSQQLEEKITQQLESSVANQFTQFQHGFVANYTANHTEAMRQVNDTIKHGVQAAVADAVQEVRTRIAEDLTTRIRDLEVKMGSLPDEAKKVDSELSKVQGTLTNLSARTDELEANSKNGTGLMSSMRSELDAANEQIDHHGSNFSELQQRVDDIETKQGKQLNQLGNVSERMDGLNSSRNETIKQLILESLDNITKQEINVYQFFKNWLDNNFVDETELEPKVKHIVEGMLDEFQVPASSEGGQLSPAQMKAILKAVHDNVSATLDKFSADKTGKADFALESAGGSIVDSRCSPTYDSGNTYVSLYGVRLWSIINSPRTVIQPGVLPGQCWAFTGNNGSIVFKLSNTIHVSEFAYEHVQPNLTTNGGIKSSPKGFSVFGLVDEADELGTHLGTYRYSREGPPLQFFPVEVKVSQSYLFIHLRIEDNYGHPDYTCLYRFRVHGRVTDY